MSTEQVSYAGDKSSHQNTSTNPADDHPHIHNHGPSPSSGSNTNSAGELGQDVQDTSPAVNNSNKTQNTKEYPSGAKFWFIMLTLCLVSILGGLDFNIVGVAVPAITQRFNTIDDIAWYTVADRLTACATQFSWGQLFNKFSLRKTLFASVVFFMAGSAISASAPMSWVMILGRAITGVGSGGMLSGMFSALVVVSPLSTRPIFTSLLSGLEAVAFVAAPLIGGALTENVSWRWCLYLNLPIGGFVLFALAVTLPDHRPEESWTNNDKDGEKLPFETNNKWWNLFLDLDLFGAIVLVVSLTCLFMTLSWAGVKMEWSDHRIIILLVLFVIFLVVFCGDQWKMGNFAALPPRVMKQRSIMAVTWFTFCLNGALAISQYYLPIYFQVVQDHSAASAGVLTLPNLISYGIAIFASGFVTSYFGYYVPFMILGTILMSIGSGLMTTWNLQSTLAVFIVFQAIFGAGSGMALEIPQIAAQTVLPEEDINSGISITLFAQNFGGALFISIAQQIFQNRVLQNLQGKVAGINAQTVQTIGFQSLSQNYTPAETEIIRQALSNAFRQVWIITVAMSTLTVIGSALTEWRSVNAPRQEASQGGSDENEKVEKA